MRPFFAFFLCLTVMLTTPLAKHLHPGWCSRMTRPIQNGVHRNGIAPTAAKNVLGTPLKPCSFDPVTGFYRDGRCNTGEADHGLHTVCSQVDERFLKFTKTRGNDLTTPIPGVFPGLKPGDRWCLCVQRWIEAYKAGAAPQIVISSTHEVALRYVDLSVLQEFALQPESTEI